MNRYSILSILVFFNLIISCQDKHKEFFEWSNNIPIGSKITDIQDKQPSFIKINWDKPEILDSNITRYYVTNLNQKSDILKMTYFLEFENHLYRGSFAHK